MKKLFSALICIVLIITAAPFALAEGVAIPDITLYYSDDMTHIYTDEATGYRAYSSYDADATIDAVIDYCMMLCLDYGFANVEYDAEASENFVYIYVKDYNGAADIEPQYLDNCPTPCCVLFGLTVVDNEIISIIATADGITLSDVPVESEGSGATITDITGANTYNYAVLPDPGLFFGCARHEDHYTDTHQCNIVSYSIGMDDGAFTAVEEYLNLLEYGGWQLTRTNYVESDYISINGQLYVDYTYSYTGSYDVGSYINFDNEWDGNVHILIGYDYGSGEIGFTFYYGEGFTLVDPNLRTTQTLEDLVHHDPSPDYPDDPEDDVPDCSICFGSGKTTCDSCWGTGQVSTNATSSGRETCDDCNGRGSDTCWGCGGSGDLY